MRQRFIEEMLDQFDLEIALAELEQDILRFNKSQGQMKWYNTEYFVHQELGIDTE